MYLRVFIQMACINVLFFQSCSQRNTELILSYYSQERSFLSKFIQHSENVTGCPSGICLKNRIALTADTVFSKIDQQFTKCDNIKFFTHNLSSLIHIIAINYSFFFLFSQALSEIFLHYSNYFSDFSTLYWQTEISASPLASKAIPSASSPV